MPQTASILSLGTRQDAVRWRDAVRDQLGATIVHDIRDPFPSMTGLEQFFRGTENWLFIAGHFAQGTLFNEAARSGQPNALRIGFEGNRVLVDRAGVQRTLEKGIGFTQHSSIRTVFWGGCSTNATAAQVSVFRALFGNHTLIGWKTTTGWEILHTVMGGFGHNPPNPSQDFFQRVQSNPDDSTTIRNSWLGAGNEANWGAGSDVDSRFSVIDPGGAGFRIENNSIRPDPAMLQCFWRDENKIL